MSCRCRARRAAPLKMAVVRKGDAATKEEIPAQALAAAREWGARMLEPMALGGIFDGIAPLEHGGGRLMVRSLLKQYALWHPMNMTYVCDWARNGWDDADLALRELIAEFAEHSAPMPASLEAYNLELISPLRIIPAKRRGRKKATQILQDIAIVVLIIMLREEYGLAPTRRQDQRKSRPSACSVVNDVLTDKGVHRGGERAIKKVWERLSPRILNGFKWKGAGPSVRK